MKMIIRFFSLTVLAVVLFAGIDNPDKPVKGEWNLKPEKIWETESAGPDIFGEIQNIDMAEDGRVYVLDSKNYKIYSFDGNGKFLSAFGKRGEGPGEFRTVRMGRQIFVVQENLVFVERGRLHQFSLDGKYNKTVIFPAQLRPRVFVTPDRFISAPSAVDDPRQKETPITLYNTNDKQSKVIAHFRPFDRATATESSSDQQVTIGIVIGDITPVMELAYRSDKIYYGMTSEYRLHIADTDGKILNQFGIPERTPRKVSQKVIDDLKGQLRDVPSEFLKRILDGLPSHASYFFSIVVGPGDEIYTFVSDPDSTSGKQIDIFSPDGKYMYRSGFAIPADHTISIFNMKDDRLAVAAEDEEGNIILTLYRLQLPSFNK